ncbi:MAG: hypothetical protein B6I22_08825 [Desulfobacteraceae bacterium 4572_123]|nr:MAG: hypothetical protein B6I22_08825 [Desulfobacteraceae bacterium 4572_123]
MLKKKLRYWLPRIFILVFAMSLLLPAPNFISGMDNNQFIIWLARLIWVIGLPVIFCSLFLLIAVLKKICASRHKLRG